MIYSSHQHKIIYIHLNHFAKKYFYQLRVLGNESVNELFTDYIIDKKFYEDLYDLLV